MNALFKKIASWFKPKASAVLLSEVDALRAYAAGLSPTPTTEDAMTTPTTTAAPIPTAAETATNRVNAAIKIALALNAIDPQLEPAAIQAGTTAALDALYPAPV